VTLALVIVDGVMSDGKWLMEGSRHRKKLSRKILYLVIVMRVERSA